jgi:hypothetical protein
MNGKYSYQAFIQKRSYIQTGGRCDRMVIGFVTINAISA